MNKPLKVLQYFKKADPKLLSHLSSTEKHQAVKQFKNIWSEQGNKVSVILERRKKVRSNRSQKEIEQNQKVKKIALDLNTRMKVHEQKRTTIQLQRIQNYKSIDISWRNKVQKININQKKRGEHLYSKAKQMSKRIEQFWHEKLSPRKSSGKINTVLEKNKSTPLNQHFIDNKSGSSNFMTEIKMSEPRSKGTLNRNSKSAKETDFPQGNYSHQTCKQKGSLFINKMRTKSSNSYIEKSNEQKKLRQDSFFQQALQKINKIMKAREKAVQKLKQASQQIREGRLQRQKMLKKPSDERIILKSPRQGKNFLEMNINTNRSGSYSSNSSSKANLRRRQLEQKHYRLRTEVYDKQRERQHRGRFHRMVKDAVYLYRLQALRQKQ